MNDCFCIDRGCGCDADDTKRTRQTPRLSNKTQAAKERTVLGPINVTGKLF